MIISSCSAFLCNAGTEDIRKQLMAIKYSGKSEEDKDTAYAALLEKGAPMWFGYLETLVAESSTGFVAGTVGISVADYLVFDLLDTYAMMQPERTATMMAELPTLTVFKAAIEARPKAAAYFATRA